MLITQNCNISDAALASLSQYDGAHFRLLLYTVTQIYRKSNETFNSLTQKTVHNVLRQVSFILEWQLQMVA